MKKILNYFMIKINSFKIKIVFIILLIYQFGLFLQLIKSNIEYNLYDLLINQFGYLSLFYIIAIGYLIITYAICENTNFYKYLHFKFKSRAEVYNSNVLVAFMMSIIFVVSFNIISIIECLGKINLKNIWSPYFFNTFTGKVNVFYTDETIKVMTRVLTPLTYVIYNNIFVILYLFFLSLLFIVSNIFFNKRALSFILVISVNAINMAFDSMGGIVEKLTFSHNIYFLTASNFELRNNLFIIYRLVYWLILISMVYFVGKVFTKKLDCKYGD